ncbi:hypothetical protein HK405_008638 [Cladochytrium tenue]|nr:hypothetical protein HK405_008638 [Cladochytrium tenue]
MRLPSPAGAATVDHTEGGGHRGPLACVGFPTGAASRSTSSRLSTAANSGPTTPTPNLSSTSESSDTLATDSNAQSSNGSGSVKRFLNRLSGAVGDFRKRHPSATSAAAVAPSLPLSPGAMTIASEAPPLLLPLPPTLQSLVAGVFARDDVKLDEYFTVWEDATDAHALGGFAGMLASAEEAVVAALGPGSLLGGGGSGFAAWVAGQRRWYHLEDLTRFMTLDSLVAMIVTRAYETIGNRLHPAVHEGYLPGALQKANPASD